MRRMTWLAFSAEALQYGGAAGLDFAFVENTQVGLHPTCFKADLTIK